METIKTIGKFLELLRSKRKFAQTTTLFRGQPVDLPLLPNICRYDSTNDFEAIEIQMLDELKRRASLIVNEPLKDDWDWLIYAQHFGLKTKLLDWTTNPLVALWFAISDERYFGEDSFLYSLNVSPNDYLNEQERVKGPFRIGKTKVLYPTLNNMRIIAQQGWFTSHLFSNTKGKYIPLEENLVLKTRIKKYVIDSNYKNTMLDELNTLGINYQSLFPDIFGVAKQINWDYLDKVF